MREVLAAAGIAGGRRRSAPRRLLVPILLSISIAALVPAMRAAALDGLERITASPNQGSVGTAVRVNGTGFDPGASVSIRIGPRNTKSTDPCPTLTPEPMAPGCRTVATLPIDDNGNFSLLMEIPTSAQGPVEIEASNNYEHAVAPFTVTNAETAAAVPTPFKPHLFNFIDEWTPPTFTLPTFKLPLFNFLGPSQAKDDEPVSSSDSRRWLAMGDSYSSGEGIKNASGGCQQSQDAYGPTAARTLGFAPFESDLDTSSTASDFLACTGAKIDYGLSRLDKLKGKKYDVVSMTFGGNNAEFDKILRDCVTTAIRSYAGSDPIGLAVGNLVGFCGIGVADMETKIKALEPKLAQLYKKAVEHLRPGGMVYVIGYPHLFAPSEDWGLWSQATTCSWLKGVDADKIWHLVDVMNGNIIGAASDAGPSVQYVAVDDLFEDRELCSKHPWINVFPTLDLNELRSTLQDPFAQIYPSFHPNYDGHQAIAKELEGYVKG